MPWNAKSEARKTGRDGSASATKYVHFMGASTAGFPSPSERRSSRLALAAENVTLCQTTEPPETMRCEGANGGKE